MGLGHPFPRKNLQEGQERNFTMLHSQDCSADSGAAASSDVLRGSVGGCCSGEEVTSDLPLPQKPLWMLWQGDSEEDGTAWNSIQIS